MKSTTTKQSPVVDNAKFVEQERSSDIRIGGDELVKNGKNVVNGIENGNAAAISNGQVKSSSSSRNDVKEGNGVLSKKKDAKAGGTPSKKDKDKNKTKKTIIVKGKTFCTGCKKKCSGDVLRVKDDKYFHMDCFKCKQCKNLLAQSGFFCEGENYYCVKDYQQLFASKCSVCNDYIDGDLISVSGNKYHQKCLKCTRCGHSFATGEKVTYSGKDISCSKCSKIPVDTVDSENNTIPSNSDCAGCHEDLQDCQALIALDRQWHVGCLRCRECSATLRGEYMGKDGVPYCEKDYQKLFGVKCAFCSRFISGKVLQAGDNHHFHPTCARCSKCGDPFGDGQEMYLQGGAIWHPKCGPGPIAENGGLTPANNLDSQSSVPHTGMNGHSPDKDRDYDRASNSGASEAQFSLPSRTHSYNGSLSNSFSGSLNRKHYTLRAGSPGLILREYRSSSSSRYPEDISRVYTYSYLTEEPTLGYLKRPIEPYDRPPTSPHFHRPSSRGSLRGSSRSSTLKSNATTKSGMKILVDSIRSEVPRPKSPYMNNEEPIELAHFPAAKPPPPGEKSKIERDDFPAPPYPYSDPERRKRLSETYRAVSVSDEDDEIDSITQRSDNTEDKLKREEQELSKISSGIGKVFLQDVREREKMQKWKQSHVDPRNASRCPSAAREPAYRLRYQSPVNASPSRNLDHARAWEEEDPFERSYSYRGSSVGRSTGAISGYNVVSSLRPVPKPGYGLSPRPYVYGSAGATSAIGDYSLNGLGKTGSNDYNVGKSNASLGSLSEVDNGAVNAGLPPLRGRAPPSYLGAPSLPYSSHFRRSLPNMSAAPPPTNLTEPGKAYPYHLLLISNYRLPNGVDRLNLERHLSDAEFEEIFQCPRAEFYRLPQWRRNELKKRARLF